MAPLYHQNHTLPPPQLPERHLDEVYPRPYNVEATPYAQSRDYTRQARHELLDMHRKFNLPAAKVIFVGDVSVGKTTMLSRFCYDQFTTNYKATIGVDFEIETFNILGQQQFTLEMWDTAGQERFKCLLQAYYRNADVIVVVFDMTKPETLSATRAWLQSALVVNFKQRPLVFLVGTKSDLVSKEEFINLESSATELAYEIRAEYWSVSARSGFKVTKLFRRIAALAFERVFKEHIAQRDKKASSSQQLPEKSSIFDFRWMSKENDSKKSLCIC